MLIAAMLVVIWVPQPTGSTAELRGISVYAAKRAWASGSGGTVLRTRGGGAWEKLPAPAGGEALDFRDIEALDGDTIVLMSAGPGDASRIFRSTDGGMTWKAAHTNPDKDGFYDAIAFWDPKNGIVMGDPVGGRFVVRVTEDGGATWAVPKDLSMPEALPGEGAFAASGTCLFARKGGDEAWFVTGGAKVARVFCTRDRGHTWTAAETPAPAGNASSGLFSIAFLDARRGYAVGGDYKQPGFEGLNGIRTEDGGVTWTPSPVSQTGFYSAVVPIPGVKDELIAVGLLGEASSLDAGRTWTKTGDVAMNAVSFSGYHVGWAAGPKGMILRSTTKPRPATSSRR